MSKRKLFTPLFLILSLLIITGCSEGNQLTLEYFVNEDGSGKVEIDFESNLSSDEKLHKISSVDQFFKEESNGQEFLLNKKVKEIIEKSTGVERWTNLNYKFVESENSSSDDPRYSVKAIAYFKNITEVDLEGIPDLEVYDFSEEELKWRFPLKSSDNKKVDQLSKEQSLQKTRMLFSFLGSSLKAAFDNGLELNYIYNLPKKIKSPGTFKKSESNDHRAEFLFTEEYMNENSSRMKEVFERSKDSLVVPIDLLNEILFGSEEEKKIKMASGLFSGKSKNYVPQSKIFTSANYSIEEVKIPQIEELQDLYIYKKGRYQQARTYDNILEYPSRIAIDRTGVLLDGVLFSKDPQSGKLQNISEVKNGQLDGAFWSFEDGRISYKTHFQEGQPTFKTKLFRKSEPNKTIEPTTLEIKKKWSDLNSQHNASIDEDEKYVWITTGDRNSFNLIRIHKESKKIKVFNELNTLINATQVTDLVVDDQGKKWVGTDNGLYTYFEGKWEQVSFKTIYENDPSLKSSSFVREVAFNSSDQSLWFILSQSRRKGGMNMIQIDSKGNLNNHTEIIRNENRYALGSIKLGTSIKVHGEKVGYLDHRGNLWLYNYVDRQKKLNKLDRQFGEDRSNFIFDDNGGVWTLSRGTIRHFDQDLSLIKILHNKDDEEFHANCHFLTCNEDRKIIYFGQGKPKSKNKRSQSNDHVVSYEIKSGNIKLIDVPKSSFCYDQFIKIKDSQAWFLNAEGKVFSVDIQSNSYENLKYYDFEGLPKHYSLLKDEENKTYITDKGNKLYELDRDSETWNSIEFKTPNSLKGEVISSSNKRWFIPTDEDQKSSVIYFWENEKWNQQDLPQLVNRHSFARGIINDKGLFLVFAPKRDGDYKVVYLNEAKEWKEINLPFQNAKRITIGHSKNTLWIYKKKEGLFKLKNNNEWMGFSGSEEWSYAISMFDAGRDELILSFDGYIMLKTAENEWIKYNFSNSGIIFGIVTDVIRDKDNRLYISFQSNSESSWMENRDLYTSNLMTYDKGNWQVMLDGSENVSGNIYDYQSILLFNDRVFLGTRHNGVLKVKLPKSTK
ncbi:MAG: hypothetical protein ACQERC_04710 [Bacteroidota bacterium]